MLQPWNDSSILPPPVNMVLCSKKVDIPTLKRICKNIIKILSKQSPLHQESALCSRFLYKYDKKFRNDIGYRNFKKVHTALKKYLALNILKDIESFSEALPTDNDDEKYLPTRQMLQYIMLRIITFSLLMLRIYVSSKQAAIFYLNRLKRGEKHWMSLLPYALLSRLWSMTMVLVQHSHSWYSDLHPFLCKLELKGLSFLPDHYELPDNLEQLLDLKNIDNFGRFDWDQKKVINVDNTLFDDDVDESHMIDTILDYVNQIKQTDFEQDIQEFIPKYSKYLDQCKSIPLISKIDHGEVLSRDSFKMNHSEVLPRDRFKIEKGEELSRETFKGTQTQNNKTAKADRDDKVNHFSKENIEKPTARNKIAIKNNDLPKQCITKSDDHTHEKITNTVSLKAFIEKEETYRNEADGRSLTDHLSLMQWHALKNALLKLCDALTNRKIDKKFKKIWKDKCLIYK